MSWFERVLKSSLNLPVLAFALLMFFGLVISGCTIQPLDAQKPNSALSPGTLSNVDILDVSNRVGQQVRNKLIFALNGGKEPIGATYSLKIIAVASKAAISVVTSTKAPTASQVTVSVSYTLKEKSKGEIIATGTRQAIASYDRTNQSFANQRAERDAEDRAANEVAEQLRLLIAATLANQ